MVLDDLRMLALGENIDELNSNFVKSYPDEQAFTAQMATYMKLSLPQI